MTWVKIKVWKGRSWEVFRDKDSGRMRVDNTSTGLSDHPVLHKLPSGSYRLVWDLPERIPKYVKNYVFGAKTGKIAMKEVRRK